MSAGPVFNCQQTRKTWGLHFVLTTFLDIFAVWPSYANKNWERYCKKIPGNVFEGNMLNIKIFKYFFFFFTIIGKRSHIKLAVIKKRYFTFFPIRFKVELNDNARLCSSDDCDEKESIATTSAQKTYNTANEKRKKNFRNKWTNQPMGDRKEERRLRWIILTLALATRKEGRRAHLLLAHAQFER